MSSNRELLSSLMAASKKKDHEAFLALWVDEDLEYHWSMHARPITSKEKLRKFLRNYEGSTDCSDRNAKNQERRKVVSETDPHHGNRPQQQQPCVGQPWSNAIAQPTNRETGHYGNSYRTDDAPSDLRFGETHLLGHDFHQRRDAKPSEETEKKRKPTHVKRPHLRGLEQLETKNFTRTEASGFVFYFHGI